MLNHITPLILTCNEAANIGRSLASLTWAKEVVVIDSFSSDETLEVVAASANTRVIQHDFDSFSDQLNFALRDGGISTEWVLRLDADHILTQRLIDEISALDPAADVAGYRIAFTYCIHGRALRGSLYPPDVVLYRRDRASYHEDGHCERISLRGPERPLRGRIRHDDRKPIAHWLASQGRYMARERDKLLAADRRDLDWRDRIRLNRRFAPLLVFFYCLFGKGLILDGAPGLFYAFQRGLAEHLLALYLLERELQDEQNRSP